MKLKLEQNEKCFAAILNTCTVLIRKNCQGCRFYKPVGCEDWVRLKVNGVDYLMDPDEYEIRRNKNGKAY